MFHWWPLAGILLLYLTLSLRMFRVISRYAVNILFGDAWDFDYYLISGHHSLWQMFSWQYGPHRAGVGALFLHWLGEWSAWNSRTEAFAAGAIIASTVPLTLVLKRRLYGQISYADALIPLLLLMPSQFGILVFGPNVSHGPFPVLLVVLYCLAWGVRSALPKYGCVLLLNFCLIYTGFGLFIGFLTPLLLGLDFYKKLGRESVREQVYTLVAICLSIASLGSFFAGYRVEHALPCYGLPNSPAVSFDTRSLPRYGWFMSLMFANFFGIKGTNFWPSLPGVLMLAAATICLAFSLKRLFMSRNGFCAVTVTPVILLSYCLMFAFFTAVGRLCLGLEAAQVSRYMPYLSLGSLGIYFSLLAGRVTKAKSILTYVLVFVALFSSLSINSADRNVMIWLAATKQQWKACYLEHHDAELCDKLTNFRVDREVDPKTRQEKFDVLQQRRLNLFIASE